MWRDPRFRTPGHRYSETAPALQAPYRLHRESGWPIRDRARHTTRRPRVNRASRHDADKYASPRQHLPPDVIQSGAPVLFVVRVRRSVSRTARNFGCPGGFYVFIPIVQAGEQLRRDLCTIIRRELKSLLEEFVRAPDHGSIVAQHLNAPTPQHVNTALKTAFSALRSRRHHDFWPSRRWNRRAKPLRELRSRE